MRFPILLSLALALVAQTARAVEVSFEQDSSLPLIYLNVVVKEGSASDPSGSFGMTNFMGEMLLRGTQSRTKEQIDLELDQMGARLEVETRPESLIFRGAVLSSQLKPFLQLLGEILTQPSLPPVELRKLKNEIVSALLEEQSRDSGLANRRFNSFLFQGHPYGKPVLGTVKDVEKFTAQAVLAHYSRLIRDHKLLVLGTGAAETKEINEWANSLGATRAGGEEPKRLSAPQNGSGLRVLIVDKPERTQTQIYAGQIGVRFTDPRFFPLYLGNHAFGGGTFSARLMQEIRVKRGWSYGAGSAFRSGSQPRMWFVHLFPAAKDTPQALALSLKMIGELKIQGITPAEFDFSKMSLVNSAGFIYNTPQKRVENLLAEKTLGLPDGFMKSYGAEVAGLNLEQVNAALKDFLKPEQLAVVVLGTAKELKPKLAKELGIPESQIQVSPYTVE